MIRSTILVALLTLAGCSGLQESYVTAMEETYDAVMLDVKHGLYQPDSKSEATLKSWDEANKKARAVLEAE